MLRPGNALLNRATALGIPEMLLVVLARDVAVNNVRVLLHGLDKFLGLEQGFVAVKHLEHGPDGVADGNDLAGLFTFRGVAREIFETDGADGNRLPAALVFVNDILGKHVALPHARGRVAVLVHGLARLVAHPHQGDRGARVHVLVQGFAHHLADEVRVRGDHVIADAVGN